VQRAWQKIREEAQNLSGSCGDTVWQG
jgi:hypothetical protein